MSGFLMDVRYAMRWFVKRPLYTFVIILSLAIGMTANTILYSFISTSTVQKLSGVIKNQEEFVWLSYMDNSKKQTLPMTSVSYRDYLEYRENNTVFSDIMASTSTKRTIMRSGDITTAIKMQAVSGNYFTAFGINPVIGRSFTSSDENAKDDYAMISYRLWNARFNEDPSVVGKTTFIDNISYTIIGVLPKRFDGVISSVGRIDAFVLTEQLMRNNMDMKKSMYDGTRSAVYPIARLGKGVDISQARAEMSVRSRHLSLAYPDTNKDLDIFIKPVPEGPPNAGKSTGNKGIILLVSVVIMLIPCVNVASLLLNRAIERAHELALRAAIGATRMRIIRQLFTELFILNICGGAAAALFFYWISNIFAVIWWGDTNAPRLDIDVKVIAYSISLCIGISLLFGLLPVIHIIRDDLASKLKSQGMGRGHGFRKVLICVEMAIALAIIILIAPIMGVEDSRIQAKLRDEPVVLVSFELGLYDYNYERRVQLLSEMLSRVKSIPGVSNAVFTLTAPFGSRSDMPIHDPGGSPDVNRIDATPVGTVSSRSIGPDFFNTLSIPIIRGRDIDKLAFDGRIGTVEVIINKSMAEKYWPNQDVLGKQIITGMVSGSIIRKFSTIVGVAADSVLSGADSAETPIVYIPFITDPKAYDDLEQLSTGVKRNIIYDFEFRDEMTLIVRYRNSENEIKSLINQEIRNIEPQLVVDIRSAEQQFLNSIKPKRIISNILLGFGMVVFIVAIIGVYAVTSHAVNHRMREIGIRMMVGAANSDIVKLLAKDGIKIVIFGTAAGVFLAWIAARWISSKTTAISAPDIPDYIVVCAIQGIIMLAACCLPIIKAIRANPIDLIKE